MSSESNVLKRVLANAGTLLGGRTVNAVVGLAYIALTARGLGKELMGVMVLINAFAQFLGEVAKFQSWQTLLQYGASACCRTTARASSRCCASPCCWT
jgi:O-antigen/teichoic acid export membrane protein